MCLDLILERSSHSRFRFSFDGSSVRPFVPYLEEVLVKVSGVLDGTAHEVSGRSGRPHVETDPGEVDDGRDAVRLDVLARQMVGPLQVLHVHDGA